MKLIGLIGGTSWPSTIEYYRLLNQMVAEKSGGYHSASLLLRSIDYHTIKSRYQGGWKEIPALLEQEIRFMQKTPCECLILCNNTLHKAYDALEPQLQMQIPFFHAAKLTAEYAVQNGLKRLLLLGTQFTMEDGFFKDRLVSRGLEVTIPSLEERIHIQSVQSKLAGGEKKPEFTDYLHTLLAKYTHLDAVVLACTELPLAINEKTTRLRIINPIWLQCRAAVDFAME